MKSPYRIAVGLIALVGVATQYWLITEGRTGSALITTTVHFFSFFTILTNALAAAAMLLPVLSPQSAIGRFLDRPSVRTAITGYIVMVGSVYYLLLRNIDTATGLHLYFEYVLHYVTPPLFVLDWLLFVPKGEIQWLNGVHSLAFPLIYLGWTLTHGALTGWYPYPFVDVAQLGYPRTLLNIGGLILVFLALEVAFVALDRLIKHFRGG